MSASLTALIPELQEPARALVDAAGSAGLVPRVTSTLRTTAEQTRLYRRYLAGLQPLPVAPPGTSAHEFGFAFDMVVTPMSALEDVGYTWEQWGGVWGGRFRDPVHFEYPGFKTPAAPAAGPVASTAIGFAEWIVNHPFLSLLLPTPLQADVQSKGIEAMADRIVAWYRANF